MHFCLPVSFKSDQLTSSLPIESNMKFNPIIFISFCTLLTLSSARVSPGHKKSFGENGVMDTFSLSFTGDIYMSRAIDGFWKIVDGISACEYFLNF